MVCFTNYKYSIIRGSLASKLPSTWLTTSHESEYTSTSCAPRSRTTLIPASKALYSASFLDALKSNLKECSTRIPSGVIITIPAPRYHGIGSTVHEYFPRPNVHTAHNPHFFSQEEFYVEVCKNLALNRTFGPISYIKRSKPSLSFGYPAREVRSL